MTKANFAHREYRVTGYIKEDRVYIGQEVRQVKMNTLSEIERRQEGVNCVDNSGQQSGHTKNQSQK